MQESEYQAAADQLNLVGLLDVLQLNEEGLKFLFKLKPYVVQVWKESDKNIPLPWQLSLFSIAGNLVKNWRRTLDEEELTNDEKGIITDKLIIANMTMARYQEKLAKANDNQKSQGKAILDKFVNRYDNPQLRMSQAMAVSIEADQEMASEMDHLPEEKRQITLH